MKKLILSAILMGSVASHAVCDDLTGDQKVCLDMRHLRSQVFALGAQRDLMLINYPLLTEIGKEINFTSDDLIGQLTDRSDLHVTALQEISSLGTNIALKATAANAEVLRLANTVQNKCAACHVQDLSGSLSWGKIFNQDWSVFYTRCNADGRQPYLCKSMYAMFSNLNQFLTAEAKGRQNYALAGETAKEIHRITTDLSNAGIFHGGNDLMESIAKETTEMQALASRQDPAVFKRGTALIDTCVKCHGANVNLVAKPLNFRPLNKK